MAEKTVRMSDKVKYELGTPVRELMDYDALRPQPIETSTPSYGFYFFPNSVKRFLPSEPVAKFPLQDIVGGIVRANLKKKLEDSIKN